MVRLILAAALVFSIQASLAYAKRPNGQESAQPPSTRVSVDFGVPAQARSVPDADPILLAKKGISLKKLRSLRIPTGDDMRTFWTSVTSSSAMARLMVAGPILGALLFGAMTVWRSLIFILRGIFLRSRKALVVDARLTKRGRFKPIVAFEYQKVQVLRLLASFDMRHDPRGEEMAVEIWGKSATVVRKRRGFFGGLFSILFPLVLLIVCLSLMGPNSGPPAG